jgi:hypothetical protein
MHGGNGVQMLLSQCGWKYDAMAYTASTLLRNAHDSGRRPSESSRNARRIHPRMAT